MYRLSNHGCTILRRSSRYSIKYSNVLYKYKIIEEINNQYLKIHIMHRHLIHFDVFVVLFIYR